MSSVEATALAVVEATALAVVEERLRLVVVEVTALVVVEVTTLVETMALAFAVGTGTEWAFVETDWNSGRWP